MAAGGILDGIDADRIESWINTADKTAPSLTVPRPPSSIEIPQEDTILLPPDSSNPRNWLPLKKWCAFTSLLLANVGASFGAVAFVPASAQFEQDFGLSNEVGTLGWTSYVLGLALGPLVLAPASEFFGRAKVYLICYTLFFLFLLGTALVQDLGGFIVLRVLAGSFASAVTVNVAGSIADLWLLKRTGVPINFYVWAILIGNPFGFFIFSFVAPTNDWRHVFWALLGIIGGFTVLMAVALFSTGETRHTIIARSQSRRLNFENENLGRTEQVPGSQKAEIGTRSLVQQALIRPFRLLFTEAIVIFSTAYVGYIFAIAVLFSYSFPVVFTSSHNFSLSDVGLAYLGPCLGITLGLLANDFQERRYQDTTDSNSKRTTWVGFAKIAALGFPISMFWYAWTIYASIHWLAPLLASVLWGWSFYNLVAMVYRNVIESYGDLSASALAAVGLLGNLAQACFPLFGMQMFTYEGFGGLQGLSAQEASTVLACLAVVVVPVPFLLERYGDKLRDRSPWAKAWVDYLSEEEGEGDDASRKKVEATECSETTGMAKEESGEREIVEVTNQKDVAGTASDEINEEGEKNETVEETEKTKQTEQTDTQGPPSKVQE